MTRREAFANVRSLVAIGLAAIGLSFAFICVGDSARAEAFLRHQTGGEKTPAAADNADTWRVEGVVVDEQGRAVGGALVRTMPVFDGPANVECVTAVDGMFQFALETVSPRGLVGLMAEADGGLRMGLDATFDRRHSGRSKEAARIVLKPSRAVRVCVRDGAGAPVAGATVEAAEPLFRTHAVAGADGVATLRIPEDAHIECVAGFRPGVGLDYFENFDKPRATGRSALPEEVTLTLEAGPTVRLKAVDSLGREVADVGIKPAFLFAAGKTRGLDARLFATLRGGTDGRGIAVFDWFPKGGNRMRFLIHPRVGYSSPELLEWEGTEPAELTVRVLRATRIGGIVRMPDTRPGRGVVVRAASWGSRAAPQKVLSTRTGDDGRYELEVPPEQAYMVAVVDDNWAARTLQNVVVREGQAQDGLDFALIKGTILRGQVTEEPGHRAGAGTIVMLVEQGVPIPEEFDGAAREKAEIVRGAVTTDAMGGFRFRVGPGSYRIQGGRQLQRTESVNVDVTAEPEVVRDLRLTLSPADASNKCGIIESLRAGEHAVAQRNLAGEVAIGVCAGN